MPHKALELDHGTRIFTMIHCREKRSLFGVGVSRHINLEEAQTIIAAIKETLPQTLPSALSTTGFSARHWRPGPCLPQPPVDGRFRNYDGGKVRPWQVKARLASLRLPTPSC